MTPQHFPDRQSFRRWLKENLPSRKELLVGFHGISTGKKSITYPQALDEALCFGWIDGVRHSLGNGIYTIRFTPRTHKSNWSFINICRAKELIQLKRMTPAGFKAFEKREERQVLTRPASDPPRQFCRVEFLPVAAPFVSQCLHFLGRKRRKRRNAGTPAPATHLRLCCRPPHSHAGQ